MSGAVSNANPKGRRLLVRFALLLAYVGLIWFVLVVGKGHTLILDNKDSEDGSVKALESLTVSVDGQEPIDLMAGDRDMAKVRGQGHKVQITAKDSQMVERSITVPLSEEVLLVSLPQLLAGKAAVIPFVAKEIAAPVDQGNGNAFTSPTDPNAPAEPGAAPVVPGAPVPPPVAPAP
jgi:hypothetical protein